MEFERLFRLSVWRPARNTSTFDYPADKTNGASFVFKPDQLQEQVYVWDPGQNDIFSALDKDLAKQFREMLYEHFAPNLEPEKRSIAQLAKVVADLNSRLQKTETICWTDSEEVSSQVHTDDENLRVNAPLALLNHLLWLTNVFGHVPGASVTIR